jgi:hypothetical protein
MTFAAGAAAQPRTLLLPLPRQPTTLAPLDVSAADVAAAEADVHAVVVYDGVGSTVDRPRPMVEAVPGMPPVPSIKLTVAATGRPVVLVLGAYSSVFWDVHVAPGARLAKVIAQGHYQPFVSELPPGTRVIVYRSEPVVGVRPLFMSGDARAFHDLWPSIRRLTGKPPTTVRAAYRGGELVVDGTSTLKPPPLDALVAAPEGVGFALLAAPGGRSADGTLVSNCGDTITYATFKANRGYSQGKLYFEAELRTPGADQPPAERTNIGVMSLAASDAGRLLAPPSHLTGTGIPVLDPGLQRAMRNGSVVGLAIDLDAGRLYHRVDGRWVGGAPGSSGGLPVPGAGEYVVAASLGPASACPGDQWVANFGAKPFRLAPPPAFVAYNQGRNSVSAFPLFADIARISRVSFDPQRGWHDRFAAAQSASSPATGRTAAEAGRGIARDDSPAMSPCGPLQDYEVHAVGVYQAKNQPRAVGPTRSPGTVRVDVVRPGAAVCLLLMAYEPVEWDVGLAPGTRLRQIIAMGYHPQTIKGAVAPGLLTLWPGPAGTDPRAFWYYGERPRESFFAERTRMLTGKLATTFQGSYYGEGFIVDGTTTGVQRGTEGPTHVIRCGGTTIVCQPNDTVICRGQRVPCSGTR